MGMDLPQAQRDGTGIQPQRVTFQGKLCSLLASEELVWGLTKGT